MSATAIRSAKDNEAEGETMNKVQRALISVTDKRGIVEFAKGLRQMDIELVSTGGTAQVLKEAGLPITSVSDWTGYPEMLEGRVKTLHPKVHGGVLARRDSSKHLSDMKAHGIEPIDMVVVNLYPFEQTIAKPGVSHEEAIENIDIGGPTLLRSAAKNYRDVVVLVNPVKYDVVLQELKKGDGTLSNQLRLRLALEAFHTTASYDAAIQQYFRGLVSRAGSTDFPGQITLSMRKVQDLRYGENPHQRAALYRTGAAPEPCVAWATVLWGKELSYNNLVDADSAVELIKEFDGAACAIIKHNNPCGVAEAGDLEQAFGRARATDPLSAFGGVVAVNRPLTLAVAKSMNEGFVEVLVAPAYEPAALEELKTKKNLRILHAEGLGKSAAKGEKEFKHIVGGLLLQDRDVAGQRHEQRVAGKVNPTEQQSASLRFAWKVAKHVRSNAIVFVTGTETAGIGAGQMSRVDSVRLAGMKAQKPLKGAVMASDAFFPFRDGIDEAAKFGVQAVVQPGGSVRDAEVVAAADEHGMAMVFTGMRHFRH